MFDDCIIMAGGSGTRLWPASNSKKPKQFLPAPGEGSFFAAAVRRGLAVTSGAGGRVIIIAGKAHTDAVAGACAAFSEAELRRMLLIPEPCARNTAPAIACALRYGELAGGGQKRSVLVLTSDHIISPLETFLADARAASAFALEDNLVVFGIVPRAPETGYGYIESAGRLSPAPGEAGRPESAVYRVASFREKPDRKTAEKFLQAGNFYWNSGMFAFSSTFMRGEFLKSAPKVIAPFENLPAPGAWETRHGLKVLRDWPGLEKAYEEAEAVSFDYAVAEKCGSTVMVRADFRWTDVGSWDEYARLVGDSGAEVYAVKAGNCFVDSDIPVALCGVEDLIVAVRSGRDGGPPAVLIAKKGETQGVREIAAAIKAAGRTELL